MNRTGLRNLLIIMAVSALVFVSQSRFSLAAVSIRQIIWVLFLAGMAVMAFQYFKENELAWYVIPAFRRKLIVAFGIAVLVLLTVGIPLLGPYIGAPGVIALAAALVVAIIWIVRESRRFR